MSGYNGRNRPVANRAPHGVLRSYASNLKEHQPLFTSYEHLQGLERGDAALTMLRKVASLVKPIMQKRGWKVNVLAEMLPPQSNLLGLNHNRGQKICLRLRYHNNPDLFLPLEQVVDTMLHELAHNVHGPHDSKFHQLWDELRDELETLMRKGYTGEGFLSEGKRLGGGRAPPPMHEMRRLARADAEKRQAQNKLTKGSGQRLGGAPLPRGGIDIRQVIADRVARRNSISTGCASGRTDAVELTNQSANNSFKTKAEEDDANNRAIMQALYELIEEEEDRKVVGEFSAAPTDGGLAWHPQTGLYDPNSDGVPGSSKMSDGAALRRAMQESLYDSNNTDRKPASNPPTLDRSNTLPSVRSDSRPSPVSSIATQRDSNLFSPVSPMTPEGDLHPSKRRKPTNRSSLSHTIDSNGDESFTTASSSNAFSPIVGIDISDPFDPKAAPPGQWECEVCTCLNPMQYLACDACTVERPQRIGIGNRGARPALTTRHTAPMVPTQPETLGWVCSGCAAFMEHRWWTCSACGRMKDTS